MCHAPICRERELRARLLALADEWEADLNSGRIINDDARYCWSLAAHELRASLEDQ